VDLRREPLLVIMAENSSVRAKLGAFLKVQSNPAASDSPMAEVKRAAFDASTGAAQNGHAVIGLVLGNEGTAQVPIKVDAGNYSYTSIGEFAKVIPIALFTPYVQFNGAGSPSVINRFAAVVIPHTAVFSNGAVSITNAATLYLDGAPDINADATVTGQNLAIWVDGDDVRFDESIWWGQDGAPFEDVVGSENSPISSNGHCRRRFNNVTKGMELSIDGEQYRPWPMALNYFENFDPPSQEYPVGETTVRTVLPSSVSSRKGQWTIIPHRWTLPAAVNVSGGQLRPGIRIEVNTGSAQLSQNTDTSGEIQVARDSMYLALANSYTVKLRLVVNNTSASPQTADIGNFQCEATFIG